MAKAHNMTHRRGITLVEVMVVLGIIALLVAILIPAVQSVRGTARRMHCASNLRQIGLAIANYEAAYRYYPWAGKFTWLPYLDQQAVYDLPWQTGIPLESRAFYDVVRTKCPPVYRCPADSAPISLYWGEYETNSANYVASSGVWLRKTGYDGILSYPSGRANIPLPGTWTRPRDVTDGLSNTAMCSEILRTDGTDHRLRAAWYTPRGYGDLDEFAEVCESIPPDATAYGWQGNTRNLGLPWYSSDAGRGIYNHASPPNRPSCLNGSRPPFGIWTAASLHGGGVNVLFGDGHVAFVGESIDRYVWRNYGSRQGPVLGP